MLLVSLQDMLQLEDAFMANLLVTYELCLVTYENDTFRGDTHKAM